jgi:hypothetical protein
MIKAIIAAILFSALLSGCGAPVKSEDPVQQGPAMP